MQLVNPAYCVPHNAASFLWTITECWHLLAWFISNALHLPTLENTFVSYESSHYIMWIFFSCPNIPTAILQKPACQKQRASSTEYFLFKSICYTKPYGKRDYELDISLPHQCERPFSTSRLLKQHRDFIAGLSSAVLLDFSVETFGDTKLWQGCQSYLPVSFLVCLLMLDVSCPTNVAQSYKQTL